MTTIYLVRHGEAEGNAFRRIHGQYDSLLTPMGQRQVQAVSRRFEDIPIDGCFSSDLTRTSLTARSVYVPKNLPLRRSPAFREVKLGRWEDLPFGYLEEFEPEEMVRFNHSPESWHIEGAETFAQYTNRFLDGMAEAASLFPGGTIAIFCHGCVLRGVLARLFFDGDANRVPYCDNTAVSKLFWDGTAYTYEFLNDNSHLPEEISTFARQKWWRQGGKRDFNLWFRPLEQLPAGCPSPERDCESYEALLCQTPVGILSLRQGVIEQLFLLPQFEGLDMEDQLLGQAICRLRGQGYTTVFARVQGVCKPEVLIRYGFREEGTLWKASIDTGIFDWSTPPQDREPE